MKIIFLGMTGVHQALIAGYYYLGQKPDADFKNLKGFADVKLEISGFPILLGQDQNDNMVYALGCETDILMMKKTIEQLRDILGGEPGELVVLPVTIPQEKLLLWLTSLAGVIGAGRWYFYVSRLIARRKLLPIYDQVKQFEARIIQH
ncbi:MAG TPA: DUF3189 family protein [Syntrophomonadaceae bacterium]|jgi:hypothetical protein|nr:DUF3189 family protein [Syntrophomonadaceae bacterium]HRX21015.1 DUF3189 family protein [Syntrophomonadaceae bacterium]